MNETEKKAVELLREEFAKVGISEVSLDLPTDAACVRAISRALEQNAWQPIETCPNEERVVMFCDELNNIWTEFACNRDDCNFLSVGFPPKYWCELPAPPASPPALTNADFNPGDIVRLKGRLWRVQGIDDYDRDGGLLLLALNEPVDSPDFRDIVFPVTRGRARRPSDGAHHRFCWGNAKDAELVERGPAEERDVRPRWRWAWSGR